MFQCELSLSTLHRASSAMSSSSPHCVKGGRASDQSTKGSGGHNAPSEAATSVTPPASKRRHNAEIVKQESAEPRSPMADKKQREDKVETMSKSKRAKLELERVLEPNRVHELLLSCGNAFGGDLTVEQVSLSPGLIPAVIKALNAVTVKDLGVGEADVADLPQFVTIHCNERFSLVVQLLPAGATLPFISHEALLSAHRVLFGSAKTWDYVRQKPQPPDAASPDKKTCPNGKPAKETPVQGLSAVHVKEDSWDASTPAFVISREDCILQLKATLPTALLQIMASPRGLHLSGARFALANIAGSPAGEQDRRDEKTSSADATTASARSTDDRSLHLVAEGGGTTLGTHRQYAGRAWGPVAIGTRMVDSSCK